MEKDLTKELVIDVGTEEVSIALLENKRLIELNKESLSADHYSVGDVYLGKVHKVMPNLNAAFVNIGDDKDAFVHYLDLSLAFRTINNFTQQMMAQGAPADLFGRLKLNEPILEKDGKIADVLKPGQLVMVQIVKEPISTKGSRLTTEISLAGRNMVLIPFSNKIHLSTKITAKEERKRLERLVRSILPANYGLIVRTAAEGKRAAVLDAELRALVRKWESVWPKLKNPKALCRLLSETSRITTILRDMFNATFSSVRVNDQAVYDEICAYVSSIMPEKEDVVQCYKGKEPIFEAFDIDRQIKGAFGRIVALRQGIYLVIDHTEALHVVDVNSGVRTKMASDQEGNAFEVNMVAAEELARQLRLRDMGGIIIVDFIDMESADHRARLFKHMQNLMEQDRAKHNILPLTKFGLMQITRQRVRPAMEINTNEVCPTCQGKGTVSSTLLFDDVLEDQLSRLSEAGHRALRLQVHPFVEAFLNRGWVRSVAAQWRKKYKVKLAVTAGKDLAVVQGIWTDKDGKKIEM